MTKQTVPMDVVIDSLKALADAGGIDRGKFKLWELEDLEDALDRPVAHEFNSPVPSIKFMRGLLWLHLRREHPTLAYDDLRQVDLDTLGDALSGTAGDDELDPPSTPTAATANSDASPVGETSKNSRASATSGV